MDSNHYYPDQNQACCHCTTAKYIVERKGLEPLAITVSVFNFLGSDVTSQKNA